jgi:uncharacterized membrane protein
MSQTRNNLFSDNVEKVVRLAEASYANQSLSTRLGSIITGGIGTMASVFVHALFIAGWVALNSGYVPGVKPFDPYPFSLLTLAVSFEGVLIALFVLLRQNRMSRDADLRAHLSLQMGMLIEQEVTAVLQLTKKMSEQNGIDFEPQVNMLLQATDIEQLAQELEKKLPEEP